MLKFNDQAKESKDLGGVAEHLGFFYQRYKGVWPVADRDFVCLGHSVKEGDKVYMGSKSYPFPCPEAEGVVRGELIVGGYILEKVDRNRTKLTFVTDADFKGDIPMLIQNQVTSKQGSAAALIEKGMRKAGL